MSIPPSKRNPQSALLEAVNKGLEIQANRLHSYDGINGDLPAWIPPLFRLAFASARSRVLSWCRANKDKRPAVVRSHAAHARYYLIAYAERLALDNSFRGITKIPREILGDVAVLHWLWFAESEHRKERSVDAGLIALLGDEGSSGKLAHKQFLERARQGRSRNKASRNADIVKLALKINHESKETRSIQELINRLREKKRGKIVLPGTDRQIQRILTEAGFTGQAKRAKADG